jgi:hypothetical protein
VQLWKSGAQKTLGIYGKWSNYWTVRLRGTGMFGKKNIGRFYGVCLATIYATLATGIVYGFWRGMHVTSVFLVFVVLWIGFYFAGVWIAIERPAELDRKFPISGKELGRRKKVIVRLAFFARPPLRLQTSHL